MRHSEHIYQTHSCHSFVQSAFSPLYKLLLMQNHMIYSYAMDIAWMCLISTYVEESYLIMGGDRLFGSRPNCKGPSILMFWLFITEKEKDIWDYEWLLHPNTGHQDEKHKRFMIKHWKSYLVGTFGEDVSWYFLATLLSNSRMSNVAVLLITVLLLLGKVALGRGILLYSSDWAVPQSSEPDSAVVVGAILWSISNIFFCKMLRSVAWLGERLDGGWVGTILGFGLTSMLGAGSFGAAGGAGFGEGSRAGAGGGRLVGGAGGFVLGGSGGGMEGGGSINSSKSSNSGGGGSIGKLNSTSFTPGCADWVFGGVCSLLCFCPTRSVVCADAAAVCLCRAGLVDCIRSLTIAGLLAFSGSLVAEFRQSSILSWDVREADELDLGTTTKELGLESLW